MVALPEGKIFERGGHKESSTNNEMELRAAIEALKLVQKRDEPVLFYTDSTYVIRGITQWVWGWMRKGWKTAEGNEVSNQDYWKVLFSLVSARQGPAQVEWKYSRGHIGTPGNERCDEIAVSFSQKKWIDLFEGSLLNYPVAIYDLPVDEPLPDMKLKQEKKVAFSYLSNVGGAIYRHKDWSGCERRVKGQSGAKFKKAMSAAEEVEILNSWGASLSDLKEGD
ncbi:MAG: ribonuclease HI [Proteobacteria bacterium]|nr:ribonuclease HI [Pseudomonadota bacterium]